MPVHHLLLFGATGSIGKSVVASARTRGWAVTAVTRGPLTSASDAGVTWRRWDPLSCENADAIAADGPFDAVCWAHGANIADSVARFEAKSHLALYQANVMSVLLSAAALVESGLLRMAPAGGVGARLVAVSSIWQDRSRGNKLSYTVTKAAIGGFVRSASVDLGHDGHLVNGVLPGVLDTPMTRASLTSEQIAAVSHKTTAGRLPDLSTVAETIMFLCSPENTSISGQSIAVDLGMTNAILI